MVIFRNRLVIHAKEAEELEAVGCFCGRCMCNEHGFDLVLRKMVTITNKEYWVWSCEYIDIKELKESWIREDCEMEKASGKVKACIMFNSQDGDTP